MTFSLVGRCARTGMVGVVVTSSSPAVAARCAWARASVGAVSTQNITDPTLAPKILDLLAAGASAQAALDTVVSGAEHAAYRQLTVVDATGRTASFSGEHTLGRHGTAEGKDCLAAGNLLAYDDVPTAMVRAFEQHPNEHLALRLLAALRAGDDAGGEEGPVHSCGVLVFDHVSWATTDLRVDWSKDPIGDLEEAWRVWSPQEVDYVNRALDPSAAPSYGVPGDE